MTEEYPIDLSKFINIKEAEKDKAASILVHIEYYITQKNLDPIIKHAISEVTKGLLSSQSHGMDHFNVVTIFPINFQKKNMDMKLIVNLSRVMIQLFPKKLLKYYVYNPPKIFNIMWGALRIVMDKDLRQKVVLVKPDNTIISNLDNNEEFNIL
jgi:hypothetical protein